MLAITIILGIIAAAEVYCAITSYEKKSIQKSLNSFQESLLNHQKTNTMLTEQLREERTQYATNRKLLVTEIALLKGELQRAKNEGFKVRPELEQEVEVEI